MIEEGKVRNLLEGLGSTTSCREYINLIVVSVVMSRMQTSVLVVDANVSLSNVCR